MEQCWPCKDCLFFILKYELIFERNYTKKTSKELTRLETLQITSHYGPLKDAVTPGSFKRHNYSLDQLV